MSNECWICVDGHGDERMFPIKPHKNFPNMDLEVLWGQRWTTDTIDKDYTYGILLPKGSVKHFTGRELTYNDEPIQIV